MTTDRCANAAHGRPVQDVPAHAEGERVNGRETPVSPVGGCGGRCV